MSMQAGMASRSKVARRHSRSTNQDATAIAAHAVAQILNVTHAALSPRPTSGPQWPP